MGEEGWRDTQLPYVVSRHRMESDKSYLKTLGIMPISSCFFLENKKKEETRIHNKIFLVA